MQIIKATRNTTGKIKLKLILRLVIMTALPYLLVGKRATTWFLVLCNPCKKHRTANRDFLGVTPRKSITDLKDKSVKNWLVYDNFNFSNLQLPQRTNFLESRFFIKALWCLSVWFHSSVTHFQLFFKCLPSKHIFDSYFLLSKYSRAPISRTSLTGKLLYLKAFQISLHHPKRSLLSNRMADNFYKSKLNLHSETL